jgi:hypothetical protein
MNYEGSSLPPGDEFAQFDLQLLKGERLDNVPLQPASRTFRSVVRNRAVAAKIGISLVSGHAAPTASGHPFRHHDIHQNQIGLLGDGLFNTLLGQFRRYRHTP